MTSVRRELYTCVCEKGEVSARLKGSFLHEAKGREDFPVVGDYVWLLYNGQGDSSIGKVLPRKSKFSRTDYSGHAAGYVKTILEQVVAANFDTVFILSSLNRDFNTKRILRYITQARHSGGKPVVVLTKADLCGGFEKEVAAVGEIAGDVAVIPISSHTGMGLEKLGPYLEPGSTVVFLGMSGVGKSSLLNALAGREVMAVKGIREEDARGRHTTTHRQLVKLPSGAYVIDTPGMREMGLWDAEEGIRSSFGEIEELITKCQFADCRHESEPGCAVKAALETGALSQKQWEYYRNQKEEAAFVGRKAPASRRNTRK